MTLASMSFRRAALLALAACLAAPAVASARPHHRAPKTSKFACGADYLALTEGAVLEYQFLPATEPPKGPKADWPTTFKVEVKKVAESGKDTTITLVETFRKVSRETTISCGEGGIKISPQSFFFVGELGGGLGMELENLKREGPDLPAPADFRSGQNWTSYIKADVKRSATEGSNAEIGNGKIEIERDLTISGREMVETGLGEQRAFRLDIQLGGRAAVEPVMDKWVDLPRAAVTLWFAPGIGLVKAENRYGHGWQLKSRELPEK